LLAEANRAHGLNQMQESLKQADSDLAQAEKLYNFVAPLFNGVQLAERVSRERDTAAKSLAEAAQIQSPSPGAIGGNQ
jgi:multidrug resistance efflux pump